jgi:hypothetical protein
MEPLLLGFCDRGFVFVNDLLKKAFFERLDFSERCNKKALVLARVPKKDEVLPGDLIAPDCFAKIDHKLAT